MGILFSLIVSLTMLMVAVSVYEKAKRVATEKPVPAKVTKVWTEHGRSGRRFYYAHLIFDRKQNDGTVVHCDVPTVSLGPQPATVGGSLTIYPSNTGCWDPDVICESCDTPYPYPSLRGALAIASISGLVLVFLSWRVTHDIRRDASRPKRGEQPAV
jgi:hypothetical protein